jgi:glycyl-tRNA synthetase beta chain
VGGAGEVKFLLELSSEEIPARMQAAAAEQLRTRFVDGLKAAGLAHGEVVADATPRRLWLIADDVAAASAASVEERKGPAATAPEAAIAGFLRSTGLTREQLEERQTPKGVVLFAQIASPGRDAAAILAELVPAIVRDFQWPKSMRWGQASVSTASPRWVRPLTGIVAMLDDAVVPCEVHGIVAGKTTRGHRVHAPEPVVIKRPDTYAAQLRAAKVVVSSAERRGFIVEKAAIAAAARGLSVVPDAGLVAENAGLTEWPVPMLGSFDPAFLAVPREVIQLTMRTNQKYFAVVDGSGALAPGFVCVANLEASDGGKAIVAGNERVLSARLSDAKFFWDQDKRAKLDSLGERSGEVVFHDRLWKLQRKIDRVASIAADRLPELVGWPKAKARDMQPLLLRAAKLAKADLASSLVGEFPELQGTIGGYLAEDEGVEVAAAIRDHYKPIGPNDSLPETEMGTLLALADKADTLHSFFSVAEKPTGSRDPFALRRAALGIIRLIVENNLRISLKSLYQAADFEKLYQSNAGGFAEPTDELVEFTIDRFKVQQREAGIRHDLIDAVFAVEQDGYLVRLLARVKALQAFVVSDDGANLLAGYKRAANILKIEGAKEGPTPDPSLKGRGEEHPAEGALASALDAALPAAAAAVAAEDFAGAMAALAGLRGPVDAFFADVMVNDRDPEIRARRLALLARFRDAVHEVADFSRIEG